MSTSAFFVPTESVDSAASKGPEVPANEGGYRRFPAFWLTLAAVFAVSFFAISSRSLWIDEACTAMKALPTSLAGWWHVMVNDKSADVQMPFYMFYVWAWARVFGSTEWSLHLANIPWFAFGAVVFIQSFSARDCSRQIATLLVLLCPFAWYYLDEARPYAMQLGAGMLIVGSLRGLMQTRWERRNVGRLNLAGFLVGIIVLSGSSLLGMVWSAAAIAAFPLLLGRHQLFLLVKQCWITLAASAVPLIALAIFYLWTLKMGARASAAATTSVGSMFFAAYELLGFTGMGPGRLEMRSAGPGALRGHLVGVGLYGLAVAAVILAALFAVFGSKNRKPLALIFCCSVPPIFIVSVGWVAHFRVLGRHLAPFVPVWLLLLTLGITVLWASNKMAARAVAVGFCVLSLLSCLSLRFSFRHEKDNYRAAADVAKAALGAGQPVWWNAAEEGARYYHVPIATDSAGAIFLMNPARETLDALTEPKLIVASKPDVYDTLSAVSNYVHHGYSPKAEFNAFIIWEKDVK